jgi:hypothetical protein
VEGALFVTVNKNGIELPSNARNVYRDDDDSKYTSYKLEASLKPSVQRLRQRMESSGIVDSAHAQAIYLERIPH